MNLIKCPNKEEFRKKFFAQFQETREENPSLNKFLFEVSIFHSLYIVGGFLRSVINCEKPRDIDLIVRVSKDELSDIISLCFERFSENRLGGFKIPLEKITVDVWSIDDNWAFKKELIKNIEINYVEKIAEGTFFNYDSLVLDLHKFSYSFKHYNYCASQKELDIIKRSSKYKKLNPTREANVLRAFYLRAKYNLSYSDQLTKYLKDQLDYLNQVTNSKTASLLQTLRRYKKYHDFLDEAIVENLVLDLYKSPPYGNSHFPNNQTRLF